MPSKTKKVASAKALNPVLAQGTNIPDEPASVTAVAVMPEPVLFEAAPGMRLVGYGSEAVTTTGLARFPQGRTGGKLNKAGKMTPVRLTGRVPNIAEYCREKTGRAFNDRHAASVLEKEQVKLQVIDKATAKELSAEVDELRKQFMAQAKPDLITMLSRGDVDVTKVQLQPTAKGMRITSTAILNTQKTTEAEQLRATIAAQNEKIRRLEAVTPKSMLKKIDHDLTGKAIDVSSTTGETAAPLPLKVAEQSQSPHVASPVEVPVEQK